jgi:hypothetical protein
MSDERDGSRKAPHTDEDQARTEDARRVAEDYASGLREILRRLRRWFN